MTGPAVIPYPVIDPVLFRFGPIAVRWYGVAYVLAFAAAWFVLAATDRRRGAGLLEEERLDMVLAAVIGVVVGGRLGYVLFYGLPGLIARPFSFLAVWEGGMSFHGGLIGLLIGAIVVSRRMGRPLLEVADIGAPSAPIGLFLVRMANFVNGELFGRQTDVPWAMVFPAGGPAARHPSQVYEAILEGLVIFVVMWWLTGRRPRAGVVFGVFLTLYGAFRIFVEFFREPDAHLGFLWGGATMGQLLSIPVLLAGVAVLAYSAGRPSAEKDG